MQNNIITHVPHHEKLPSAAAHQRAAEPPGPPSPPRSAGCQEVAKESEERRPGVRVEEEREKERYGVQPEQQAVGERLAGSLESRRTAKGRAA